MAGQLRVLLTLAWFCIVLSVESIRLSPENCRPRPTVVSVDPSNHNYLPYFVTLDRCGGSVGSMKPSLKTCVASVEKTVNVSVIDTEDFAVLDVPLVNHTACESRCVKSEKDCDLRFQTWSSHNCACGCKYTSEPSPKVCVEPFIWSQTLCSCRCRTTPLACPSNKEWRTELCGCACKSSFSMKCAKDGNVLDPVTCQCVPPPTITTGTSSGRNGAGSDIPLRIVIVIIVVELLIILAVFYLIYVYCKRKNNKHNSSFWKTARKPQRWFTRRQNAYHVDNEPRLDDGSTATPDGREEFDLHEEEDYAVKSSERDSSEAEIFYESQGWHTEVDTDRHSLTSMDEDGNRRITRV